MLLFLLTVAALISVVGCTPQPKVFHLSGNVSFQGQPIPKGRIFFDPDGHGEQGVAEIEAGKYDTRKGELGIKGGKYIVRIQGFDGQGGDELPWGQPLFNEYQTKVELPDADKVLDFDVPGSP